MKEIRRWDKLGTAARLALMLSPHMMNLVTELC